jgi:hypothetical protein
VAPILDGAGGNPSERPVINEDRLCCSAALAGCDHPCADKRDEVRAESPSNHNADSVDGKAESNSYFGSVMVRRIFSAEQGVANCDEPHFNR